MAAEQQQVRLPCQRCLRRLSRGTELDRPERLTCDKQAGHLLCDYCASGRKACLAVRLCPLKRQLLICVIGPCLLQKEGEDPSARIRSILQ